VNSYWETILVFLHLRRRRSWHWPWQAHVKSVSGKWYENEPFILLYNELSKGGCQDYVETTIPTIDENKEWCEGDHISYLRFDTKRLCIGGWLPSTFVLGSVGPNDENMCPIDE
jgi:hypothetical protein